MSCPYFFINKENIVDNSIFISGNDYNHLVRVLRTKTGDTVEVSDNESRRYSASVAEIRKEKAVLLINEIRNISRSYPQITLFLCILKKDTMEYAIQKTAEIGIDEIAPVFSRRVVVELGSSKIEGRISRWQNIAEAASKQCMRDFECRVLDAVKINAVNPSLFDIFFIPLESKILNKDHISLAELDYFLKSSRDKCENESGEDKGAAGGKKDKYKYRIKKDLKKIGYIIGPEGGFEDNEVEMLLKKGAVPINFGKNILRSETASIYFLSVLDYIFKTLNAE
ncbi:MAG: 16S rRNA (uracil(1498)-N(3))-methyltransferase [Actinobacteria bacterium]|nr:16S rRNA (uracil(1498)-N(3))-methyltransferase [Actinomycetota bacterium]